jgi:hypothetical protein
VVRQLLSFLESKVGRKGERREVRGTRVKEHVDEMTDEGEGSRKKENCETTPRITKKKKKKKTKRRRKKERY